MPYLISFGKVFNLVDNDSQMKVEKEVQNNIYIQF